MLPAWTLSSLLQTAAAGDDPWIAPQGTTNVFVAVAGEQFQDFATSSGPSAMSAPIRSVSSKLYLRRGLAGRADVSLDLPVAVTWAAGDAQDPLVATTAGVQLVQAEVRKQWWGALSTRAAVRSGVLHQGTRGRLTNLGEGTTDLGLGLGCGTVLPTGPMFATVDAGAAYWLRAPLRADGVPADEITWSANAVLTPRSALGVGLSAGGLHRLGGQDLGAVSVADPDDRWAALHAQQVKVGGRIILYSTDARPAISLALLRAVWAQNNPTDTIRAELGVGWDLRRER